MWSNYLKVGWRNTIKNQLYSLINAFGLALGIGFSYLTFLYVSGEFRFDKFHENTNRIHRVIETNLNRSSGEVISMSAVTAVPLGHSLEETYPEIERVARLGSNGSIVKRGDESFSEVVVFGDKELFEVFTFESIVGANNFFNTPNEVVLSETVAIKYFGSQDVIGKSLSIMLGSSFQLFTVAAVVDNHMAESSLAFDVMIPFKNFEHVVGVETFNSMNYGMIETYLLLVEGESAGFLEEKINKSYNATAQQEDASQVNQFLLQPLSDIHLNVEVPRGIARQGNPTYLYVLSGAGLLILLMACVNFVSLTSGHTFTRVREVGVRKVMGAYRTQIRYQLIVEAFIVCTIAATIGLFMVYFAVPFFNLLINSSLSFFLDVGGVLFLLALIIFIALIAGGIPAQLLVRLQPVQALKNGVANSGKEVGKQGLVMVQFVLTLMLVIGTFVMSDQMNFIQEKNLGFDKERLFEISLNNPSTLEEADKIVRAFKSKASSSTRIVSTTATMNDYQEPWTKLAFEQIEGPPIELFYNMVEPDYKETMGLELASGRWFDNSANLNESTQIVVNEALVKYFDWSDHVGKQLPGKNFGDAHEIIGVIKDFHFSSLHNKVEPLILAVNFRAIGSGVTGLTTYRWPPLYNDITLKLGPGELRPALKEIEATWNTANPDAPFSGHFVDQLLEAQYANEQRWKKIINYSSVFAYCIALLGLIGVVKLLLQGKVKEIGIRKVLGSSYRSLLLYFSKGFVTVILIANLIAWPAVWWACRQWLQSFPYRVELSPIPFVLAMLVVGVSVFLVVGYLTWLASRARPVDVLKNE